jgi:hypothetical protein
MRPIRAGGLCLLVAVAFSAIVASGAQAATYKWCVAQKKGEYADSQCKTKSAKAHKGHYELAPIEACVLEKKGEYTDSTCTTKSLKPHKGRFARTTGHKFTGSSGPAEFVETNAIGNPIECAKGTSAGEITGPKTATVQTRYTGCTFVGLPCKSGGPDGNASTVEGEIITNLAQATLLGPGEKASGPEGATVPAGEVWNELVSIEHPPYQFELECPGALSARTFGSIAGVQAPVNTLKTTNTITFSETAGESGLESETAEPGFKGPWSAPHHVHQTQTITLTFEKWVDISTE